MNDLASTDTYCRPGTMSLHSSQKCIFTFSFFHTKIFIHYKLSEENAVQYTKRERRCSKNGAQLAFFPKEEEKREFKVGKTSWGRCQVHYLSPLSLSVAVFVFPN